MRHDADELADLRHDAGDIALGTTRNDSEPARSNGINELNSEDVVLISTNNRNANDSSVSADEEIKLPAKPDNTILAVSDDKSASQKGGR